MEYELTDDFASAGHIVDHFHPHVGFKGAAHIILVCVRNIYHHQFHHLCGDIIPFKITQFNK